MKFCKRCVCDGTISELVLDENGVCNFCHIAQRELKMAEVEKPNLEKRIEQIKRDGRGKKYDAIIGLSGGLDSSMTLHYAVKMGLRVLAYSVDNGWNLQEKSDSNIMKMVEELKVPFYRYNIDLKKFKELQGAFLKAGLINIEIPTDHILMATSYEMASKYNCKWILSGGNVNGESIMPESWSFNARDLTHIKDVYKKMIGKRLKGLPLCGLLKLNYYKWVKGIKFFYLLDYLDYNLEDSRNLLNKLYGWESYGEKHEESVFTKWMQSFYLFEKFGIDKRKAHFSSLINSGQMTRKEAIEKLLEMPVYPLLGIEQRVMSYRKRQHNEFKVDKNYNRIAKLVRFFKNGNFK